MIKYWFRHPGILSTEACRMALALTFLLINYRGDLISAEVFYGSSVNPETYSPKGILALFFPAEIPGEKWINSAIFISKTAPWFLMAGLFSRPALLASVISHLFLQTLRESFGESWSHGYNVVLLCGLAFMFAPVGQKVSVDDWIRKKFRRERVPVNGFNFVLLAQWAAALMFFSAFFHKIIDQRAVLHFNWIFTDNLRHHLVQTYMLCGRNMPDYVYAVASNPFLYKSLALLSCICQLLPLAACFCTRRPVLRAVFGFAFVLEEAGLGILMQLNDYHWYPLYALFIDWDFFLGRHVQNARIPLKKQKLAYSIAFLSVYIFFSLKISDKVFGFSVFDANAYPFSQFSMFANVIGGKNILTPAVEFDIWYEKKSEPGRLLRNPQLNQRILSRFYYLVSEGNDQYHRKVTENIRQLLEKGAFGFDGEHCRLKQVQIFICVKQFTAPPRPPGLIPVTKKLSAEQQLSM